jgi:hypothetical protein
MVLRQYQSQYQHTALWNSSTRIQLKYDTKVQTIQCMPAEIGVIKMGFVKGKTTKNGFNLL